MAKPKTPPALQINRTYCEHCSHEVPFNAEICPHCKKTFSAVRCPVCKHSGPPSQFQNGCPSCGHLSHRSHLGRRGPASVEERRKNSQGKKHDVFIPLMMLFVATLFGVILYFYLNR